MCNEEVKQEEEEISEIDRMREEIRLAEDKYIRALAETENRTKRMQKEKQDMMRFAVQNAITEFLPVLDNFEKALGFKDQMSDETKNWAMGFEMILGQLKGVVSNHGFTPFHAEGLFDPHLHEALEIEESDEHPDGTILKEFQRGYKCGDRIVCPARVKVSKLPKKEEEKKEEENHE
ncbi:MAG: nucleotide exchange factor GrpE [Chlamydiia bacterium]|nr:nucleotide exchange factor GrpE [Chlamydiia bacterium]